MAKKQGAYDSTITLDAESVTGRRRGGGRAGSSNCVSFDSRGGTDETEANATTFVTVSRAGRGLTGIHNNRAIRVPYDDPGRPDAFEVE